jgi:beta-lactam-binding protein with PASTA domain
MGFFQYVKSKDGKRIVLKLLGVYVGVTVLIMLFLWWYTDHGQQVSVPDLKGKTLEEASMMLEERDLVYLVVDSIYDRHSKGGTIVEQSPAPEQKVKEGRAVFLTVYRMMPPQETINIKEGDFAQVAIIKLKNKGIDYTAKYVPNNALVGAVVSITYKGQKIKPGQQIPRGERVVLTIGTAADETVGVPNLAGLNYNQAMTILDSLNLMGQAFFMFDVQSSADSAVGRICEQDPAYDPEAPGVAPGHIIDFRLYNEPCPTDSIP